MQQSLRHGYAAPPPFTQGRLTLAVSPPQTPPTNQNLKPLRRAVVPFASLTANLLRKCCFHSRTPVPTGLCDAYKLGFIGELTATQKPRPPCVKGAPDEDGWGIVFPYATIPPSRLRRATSLYTREAYARHFATPNPPINQNLKPLRRTVEDAGPYGFVRCLQIGVYR